MTLYLYKVYQFKFNLLSFTLLPIIPMEHRPALLLLCILDVYNSSSNDNCYYILHVAAISGSTRSY